MNKKELWLKLKHYHFDHVVPRHLGNYISLAFGGADASNKAFAGKIARKSGWTVKFALRALNEYKKFVYLGVVSDFNVTPSKIVDQVWHEHLMFSKAYRQFCNRVINYTLDHNPELIPMTDQTGIFNAQYLDTIALYEAEFGVAPPADIWGLSKFAPAKIIADNYKSNEKRKKKDYTSSTYSDITLVSFFEGAQYEGHFTESFPEFGGFAGGDSGGGGASGSWDSHNADSPGASDGSNGGSDSGGSGCSSGCSGGGD